MVEMYVALAPNLELPGANAEEIKEGYRNDAVET